MLLLELRNQSTIKVLLASLEGLSNGLLALYRLIMCRMAQSLAPPQQQIAMKVLAWVAVAFRPLTLSEIADGLTVENLEVDESLRIQPKRFILGCCSPLIEIYDDETVHFAHTSVKNFLIHKTEMENTQKGTFEYFFVFLDRAHRASAESCLAYLHQRRWETSSGNTLLSNRQPKSFLRYAALYWHTYLELSGPADDPLLSKVASFLDSSSAFALFTLLADLEPLVGHFGGHLLMMQKALERWVFGVEVSLNLLIIITQGVSTICERGLAE